MCKFSLKFVFDYLLLYFFFLIWISSATRSEVDCKVPNALGNELGVLYPNFDEDTIQNIFIKNDVVVAFNSWILPHCNYANYSRTDSPKEQKVTTMNE